MLARLFLCALLVSPTLAAADGLSADRAREAVQKGEIEPLSKALSIVEERFSGNILEVELEREHGAYIYEIKVLVDGGRVVEIVMDAKSLEVLEVEDD